MRAIFAIFIITFFFCRPSFGQTDLLTSVLEGLSHEAARKCIKAIGDPEVQNRMDDILTGIVKSKRDRFTKASDRQIIKDLRTLRGAEKELSEEGQLTLQALVRESIDFIAIMSDPQMKFRVDNSTHIRDQSPQEKAFKSAIAAKNWSEAISVFRTQLKNAERSSGHNIRDYALALYHRGSGSDRETAARFLETHMATHGPDGEGMKILGLIYRDKFTTVKAILDLHKSQLNEKEISKPKEQMEHIAYERQAREALEKAIEFFREAYWLEKGDHEIALYLLHALLSKMELKREANIERELIGLANGTLSYVERAIERGDRTYWTYATHLQLLIIGGLADLNNFDQTVNKLVSFNVNPYFFEATIQDLHRIGEILEGHLPLMQAPRRILASEAIRAIRHSLKAGSSGK